MAHFLISARAGTGSGRVHRQLTNYLNQVAAAEPVSL